MKYSKDKLRLWILIALIAIGLPSAYLWGDPETEPDASEIVAGHHFAYLPWSASALQAKGKAFASGDHKLLAPADANAIVKAYFVQVAEAQTIERDIQRLISDPNADQATLPELNAALEEKRATMLTQKGLVEAILQDQVSTILAEEGFGVLDYIVPPVAASITALPERMIVSSRDKIQQIDMADLAPNTPLTTIEDLEATVDAELDVASLVVPLGGLSLYPAMVYETGNLNYTVNVIAHEWAHHYLMVRPLGYEYFNNPQTQVINETTASVLGDEIGAKVIERFYPELVPKPVDQAQSNVATPAADADVFDFHKEMGITRVKADALLAEGKIEEAEAYMNERQALFFEEGYLIRKINQAYFAFYGAYADQAGARGEDPIGPAVLRFREQSDSLHAFITEISWLTTLEEIEALLEEPSVSAE